jgi:Carbohydrate esterase, sialic acid-specific acetylesterase
MRWLTGLLLLAFSAFASAGNGVSPPDPNYVTQVPINYNLVNQKTSGLAFRSLTVNTGIRNLIAITVGQSLGTAIAPTAYTPTNASAIDNINVYDGAIYEAKDPLLGCSTDSGVAGSGPGNPFLRMADNLITAGLFDRVILVPLSIGGTLATDWQTGFASNRIQAALSRLNARGIVAGTNVTIVILVMHGESDALAGTSGSAYTASWNAIIAKSRASGFSGTWFFAEESYTGSVNTTIQTAQLALVNHGSGVWLGPVIDSFVGSVCGPGANAACRLADNTHETDAGSYSMAAAWQTALHLFGAPF